MADATVLRGGQINGSGDATALFLKVYGGEVLTAFDEATVFKDRHTIRTIANGKSAQFPATWKVASAYHTVGAEIVGQAANLNERVIAVDGLLVSSVFFANIDEAMSHYDYRSEYTRQTGLELANVFDENVSRVGILAARASATVTGGYNGGTLNDADSNTNGSSLAASIYSAAQALDEKDVPSNDRYAYVKPAQYYLLAQTTALINKDWDGSGSYSKGSIYRIADVEIIKTNHLATANDSSNTNIDVDYRANYNTTTCLVMNKGAVGTVKLMDLAVESQYDIRRQGTLVVAKYAMGHGILRPECAFEIRTATPV